jgi:hypothetical protein
VCPVAFKLMILHTQVSMSMFGFDVPCGRNQVAASRRKKIFDVIAPYVMSQEDIDTVASRPAYLRDLWLESFANAARTMLSSKLQIRTKELLRKFFPSNGLLPTKRHAALIGMAPNATILDR